MTHNVYAGTWEIAGEAGMNKSIARFPDVCMSPPSPPAGPLPIPYPDTSFSTDLKEGSTTVKAGGKPIALKQQSYYKASVLGNEAATRSFGASVISHQITGKTYFQSWCMDVKADGENVCRHLDLTTSNHACDPPPTPPLNTNEAMAIGDGTEAVVMCQCCGKAAHSEAQRQGQGMTEEEFYGPTQTGRRKATRKHGKEVYEPRKLTPKELKQVEDAKDIIERTRQSECAGQVPPRGDGPCNKYYMITAQEKAAIDSEYSALVDDSNPAKPEHWKGAKMVAHRVPRATGGCPTGPNAVPVTSKKCKDWDNGPLANAQSNILEIRRDR